MADFVKDAFRGAMNVAAQDEFHAYQESIVDKNEELIMTAGLMVGLDRMDALSQAVLQSGQQEALADFVKYIAMAAFHAGYSDGKKSL